MSEHDSNHPDYVCRGPLSEQERDTFDTIAGFFTDMTAEAPSVGWRESGTPDYREFVTTEGDVEPNYQPVRLVSLPAGALVSKELAHSLAPLDRQVVGVDSRDHLLNAQIVLAMIGDETNAPLQPQRERLS